MPTRRLTDLFVERAKPPARGRVEYFDAAFPGLALRITENGGKSWCAFYRFSGRLRRVAVGRLSVNQASAGAEGGGGRPRARAPRLRSGRGEASAPASLSRSRQL